MAGVKIEQGTLTHRKTLRLKGLLGIGVAQAVGHLTMLWVWAASSTKDGSLAGMTPTEIAEVSGWAGEPADFLAAMIDAGYIDEAPGGSMIGPKTQDRLKRKPAGRQHENGNGDSKSESGQRRPQRPRERRQAKSLRRNKSRLSWPRSRRRGRNHAQTQNWPGLDSFT